MSAALLEVILFAAQQLIKHAPEMAIALKNIFSRDNVTVEELQSLRDQVARDSYESLITNSDIQNG